MRESKRTKEPEILVSNGSTWSRQWAELRLRNPSAQFSWYRYRGKTVREWILPLLKDMTQGHCAFCDAHPLDDRSKEPIEHFRPKHLQQFYSLSYSWSNLYYSCERCQSEKGTKWNESLLAPDESDYSTNDFFEFDIGTGEIAANRFATSDQRDRANGTIEMFGLNRGNRPFRRRQELARWKCSSNRDLEDYAYRDFIQCGSFIASEMQ